MITAQGSVGSAFVRNASSPREVSVTLGATVPVGDFLVIWFVTHTAWNIAIPTDSYNWAFAYDDKLNPWTLVAATQHSDTTDGGVMVHMHVAEVQRALTSGDKVYARVGNHFSGNTWARAMSVEQFSVSAGNRLAISGEGFTANSDGSPSDPAAISFDFPGPDREVLFIHGLGFRGPVTDTFTWDSDYTQIVAAGSNTGTPNDDRTIMGGYRIDTLSGNADSVDVTSTTDRSWAQVMQALVEVRQPVGFPISPVRDDFNRADESPLDGGLWYTDRRSFGSDMLDLTSNQTSGGGGSQFIGELERCQEVYGTITDWSDSVIHFNADGDVALANFEARGAEWMNPHIDQLEAHCVQFGLVNSIFGRIDHRMLSYPVGDIYPSDPSDGVKMGIRRARQAELYVDHLFLDTLDGDGWRCMGSMCVSVNSGVAFEGRMSIGTVSGKWDDFGGGEIPCFEWIPQIYRRQWEFEGVPLG